MPNVETNPNNHQSSHIVILSEAKNLGLIGNAPTELGQRCFASLNMTALSCETNFEFACFVVFLRNQQSGIYNLEYKNGSDSIVA